MNVFVYCEIDKYTVEEVSYELLTKGRKLANELGVQLEAVVAGTDIKDKVEKEINREDLRRIFLEIYANPVVTKELLAKEKATGSILI